MSTDPTYVVQVFSTFAPSHLVPLLVRVPEDATVETAIATSLEKLLDQDPTCVLPSDMVDEYSVRVATGSGQPQYQSLPFAPQQVLRVASGMEFPFMVFLAFTGRANSQTAPTEGTHTPVKGTRHPLSGAEKGALEAQRQQIEARRLENIRRIEQKRMEDQVNAFNRCETYEMNRRANEAKEREREARLEQSREADRAAHEAASAARAAQEASDTLPKPSFDQAKETERMRKSMKSALMSEARRQQDLAQALEIKQLEERKERDRRTAEKRRQAEAERGDRMFRDIEGLLADLDNKCDVSKHEQDTELEHQRRQRQMFQSAAADTKAITLLEYQRNGKKLLSRDERKAQEAQAEEHKQLLELQEVERLALLREQESEHHANWRAQQDRSQQELIERFEQAYKGATTVEH